ncbi:uncharacterized protein LOC101847324 [Aplysia californica]|uniref:Uncharacterized protein LOC101847324 n=1 Tax=Aplysia californica TaxID=6500 RepID=A0ABM0JJA8_APLCA|nr:uncharacterized protein LOC101847324 [Aplysia californica]
MKDQTEAVSSETPGKLDNNYRDNISTDNKNVNNNNLVQNKGIHTENTEAIRSAVPLLQEMDKDSSVGEGSEPFRSVKVSFEESPQILAERRRSVQQMTQNTVPTLITERVDTMSEENTTVKESYFTDKIMDKKEHTNRCISEHDCVLGKGLNESMNDKENESKTFSKLDNGSRKGALTNHSSNSEQPDSPFPGITSRSSERLSSRQNLENCLEEGTSKDESESLSLQQIENNIRSTFTTAAEKGQQFAPGCEQPSSEAEPELAQAQGPPSYESIMAKSMEITDITEITTSSAQQPKEMMTSSTSGQDLIQDGFPRGSSVAVSGQHAVRDQIEKMTRVVTAPGHSHATCNDVINPGQQTDTREGAASTQSTHSAACTQQETLGGHTTTHAPFACSETAGGGFEVPGKPVGEANISHEKEKNSSSKKTTESISVSGGKKNSPNSSAPMTLNQNAQTYGGDGKPHDADSTDEKGGENKNGAKSITNSDTTGSDNAPTNSQGSQRDDGSPSGQGRSTNDDTTRHGSGGDNPGEASGMDGSDVDRSDVDALTADRPADGDVVVVTGGCGFLGQHIVKMLQLKAPHVSEIRVLDLRPFQQRLAYEPVKPIKSLVGSITDADFVTRALRGADCVMHVAGLVSFGTFPDFQNMEKVNVQGTLNVLNASLRQNVPRLLYCSTVDVAVGRQPIRGGDEHSTPRPHKFLFPGYPDTKYHGERLVLAGDTNRRHDGGKLQVISLRANVMYGELDPFYVTSGLKNAKKRKGVLSQVGDGTAMFQQAYAGNTAWAFVCGDLAMREDPMLTGEIFYVPDNTPVQNSFNFMRPYLEARGYRLSDGYLSYPLVHGAVVATEMLVKALSPLVRFSLPTQSYSLEYINTDLYFSGNKARSMLRYEPLYSPSEARTMSLPYYMTVNLDSTTDVDWTPEDAQRALSTPVGNPAERTQEGVPYPVELMPPAGEGADLDLATALASEELPQTPFSSAEVSRQEAKGAGVKEHGQGENSSVGEAAENKTTEASEEGTETQSPSQNTSSSPAQGDTSTSPSQGDASPQSQGDTPSQAREQGDTPSLGQGDISPPPQEDTSPSSTQGGIPSEVQGDTSSPKQGGASQLPQGDSSSPAEDGTSLPPQDDT